MPVCRQGRLMNSRMPDPVPTLEQYAVMQQVLAEHLILKKGRKAGSKLVDAGKLPSWDGLQRAVDRAARSFNYWQTPLQGRGWTPQEDWVVMVDGAPTNDGGFGLHDLAAGFTPGNAAYIWHCSTDGELITSPSAGTAAQATARTAARQTPTAVQRHYLQQQFSESAPGP